MGEAGLVDGDKCNRDGCTGDMVAVDDDSSCSCHICPPCNHCVDMKYYCNECGFETEEPEPLKSNSSGYVFNYGQEPKTIADLDNSKIDYLVIPGSYYNMIYDGVFPKGTTMADILKLFNTCFGCRWLLFDSDLQRFKLKVYTD